MTILPMFDYGDVIYRSASKSLLQRLDVLYHSVIWLGTNAPHKTHHCTLYSSLNWPLLYTCRKIHWFMLIYKTFLGLSPPYLQQLLHFSSSVYNTLQPETGMVYIKPYNWTLLSRRWLFKLESWIILKIYVTVT